MSEAFKIQQSLKVGPTGQDMINLRADSGSEFEAIANWTIANAALFVNVQAALSAVPPALAAHVTNVQVQQEPPQQPAYQQPQEPPPSPWSQPQQQAAPPWSQPATQGPVCQHGAMEWKDFVSKAGNHVKGHFCTQRNSTCKPVYAPK